jgi:CDP-diacylglycerol--glycerol-3-phosphate 3-phosphatidyltransferase
MAILPNAITVLRLLLLPLIVWLSYSTETGSLVAALLIFNAGAASDLLDGVIARRYGAESRLGKLLDPVVDKIYILSVLYVFVDLGLLPLWLVLLSMAREFLVSAARHSFSTPRRAIGANWMGKSKFVLQVIIIEVGLLHLVLESTGRAIPAARAVMFWLTLAMVAISYAFLFRFARGLQLDAQAVREELTEDKDSS